MISTFPHLKMNKLKFKEPSPWLLGQGVALSSTLGQSASTKSCNQIQSKEQKKGRR